MALPAPTAASPSPALQLAEVKKDVEDLAKEEPLDASYEPRPGTEFEEKEIEGVSFAFCFFRISSSTLFFFDLLSHPPPPLSPSPFSSSDPGLPPRVVRRQPPRSPLEAQPALQASP